MGSMDTTLMNVLIIGDNADVLMALKAGLGCHVKGCTILTAANGTKGNEILRSTRVDMVITDLDMLAMSGYHFVETARSEYPQVPVCVMASTFTDVRERLHALGIRRCIRKPFNFTELVDAIRGEILTLRNSA